MRAEQTMSYYTRPIYKGNSVKVFEQKNLTETNVCVVVVVVVRGVPMRCVLFIMLCKGVHS